MQIALQAVMVPLQRLREALQPWLRWWLDELRSMWNDALDRLLPSARTFTEVRRDDGGLELVQRRGASILASHRLAEGTALPPGLSGSRAIVHLAASELLVKRLTLPAAIEPRLRESLRLRLDREMPLSADHAYFDCAVVRREPGSSSIDVELAIAKRSCVDAWEVSVRRLGLRPIAIGRGPAGARSLQLNFLRSPAAPSGHIAHRYDRPLLAAAIVLAVALSATVAWQWRAERKRIDTAIASISAAAADAQASREKLVALVDTAQELQAHLQRPTFSEALTELTRSLASDVWVHSLQFRGGEVQVSGIGPNAAALAGQLEQSALFEHAALKSTTSAGLGTGQDRFDITLRTSGTAP